MKASQLLQAEDFDYRDDFDVVSWAALISVIEAAEREHPEPHYYWSSVGEGEPSYHLFECPMCSALFALTQALSTR